MTDLWRKDYNKFYSDHMKESKFVYDIDWCKSFINTYIETPKEKQTILDVGCGDGVWSIVLSDYFEVTGIDNSKVGIENAVHFSKEHGKNIIFICDDIEIMKDKYDVVFCRCPDFFSGYAPDDPVFQKFIPIVLNLCKNVFYFIVYSKPPFNKYANEEKTSYFHDPEILKEIFKKYGSVSVIYEQNYIVLKLIFNKYIFFNSIGRSGTSFSGGVFKNVTNIPSFHGTEKKIRDLVDSKYLKNNKNKKLLLDKIKLINELAINGEYCETTQTFSHCLSQPLLDNHKRLYVVNMIRNPLEVAISYENRNSFPSREDAIWRIPLNSEMRFVKITENLTIFQENLLDWVDSQIIFNNNKDKYFKIYEFLFTNINNLDEWEKLFAYFEIQYNKQKLKEILNNNDTYKASAKQLGFKDTIITERHILEKNDFIEILKKNNYYHNYIKKFLY
jgi:SAM-dependent methyltransferase